MFSTHIKVEGRIIGGEIKSGKFVMTMLNPSMNSTVPPIHPKTFNKELLDITIKELQAVREKLE